MALGSDPVEHLAQAFALPIVEALRDAAGVRLRHEDDESTRDRDFLGETGTLHADGVLRDLADDRLTGPQQMLDAGRARVAFDPLVAVRLDVTPVENGVLRRPDVDERRLHARQDILHPAPVDVAVDLVGVVERPGDVVLDERAPLEHRNLRGLLGDVDAHQVAPDRPPLAFPASAPAGGGRAARLVAGVGLLHSGLRAAGDRTGGAARGRAPARAGRPAAGAGVVSTAASVPLVGPGRRRPPRPRPPRRRRGFGAPAAAVPFTPGLAARGGGAGRVSPIFGLGGDDSGLSVPIGASRAAPDATEPTGFRGSPAPMAPVVGSDMREIPSKTRTREVRGNHRAGADGRSVAPCCGGATSIWSVASRDGRQASRQGGGNCTRAREPPGSSGAKDDGHGRDRHAPGSPRPVWLQRDHLLSSLTPALRALRLRPVAIR